ncbi:MAG TPA: M20/M25/M40 family metallo-hydrolase [Gemmatimonadales bacterium]|nr:M20/M25/M40 family metallo-hydrolase [Gemmatimonadales bacterium]
MRRSLFLVAIVLTATARPIVAQDFFITPKGFTVDDPVLRRIWALGIDSSHAPFLAQRLMDSIGPRLTASPGMEAGQAWLLHTYAGWNVTARKEQMGTWRSWRRGITHLDLLVPRVRTLEAQMLSWSEGTPAGRPVRGNVVTLPDVADSPAFVAWLPKARGKFVMTSFPPPTCRPDESWEKWELPDVWDTLKAQRTVAMRQWRARVTRTGYQDSYGRQSLARRLAQAGVAGILTNRWSGGWGADQIFDSEVEGTPVVDVSCEDYGLLYRLASENEGPVVQLEAQAVRGPEAPVYNVVAELKGAALPNEYVLLSAHFDSWDGGSGATDNGTGSITMLEAMRILAAAYPHPRRTILVGHWTGEELGLEGSRAFVADHPAIMDSLQAAFNQDAGTGRVIELSSSGFTLAAGNLARYLVDIPGELTRNIKFTFPGPSGPPDDYASFVGCGAPGFNLASDDWDYMKYTWHTNRDTYDKIAFADVEQNATLVAMLAYLASEDPQFMPRDRRTVIPMNPDGTPQRWMRLDCTQPDRKTPAFK